MFPRLVLDQARLSVGEGYERPIPMETDEGTFSLDPDPAGSTLYSGLNLAAPTTETADRRLGTTNPAFLPGPYPSPSPSSERKPRCFKVSNHCFPEGSCSVRNTGMGRRAMASRIRATCLGIVFAGS